MKYILIGNGTSPYVRKLRLVMRDIPYEFKVINYLEKMGNDFLKSVNPINKIPVLLAGEQVIFDSRVIYNYLAKKSNWPELSLDDQNRISVIDGAMDASINLFSLQRAGLDLNSGNLFIERQQARVEELLKYLAPWVNQQSPDFENNWNFATISLYSYLDWLQFRKIKDLNVYPEMKNFLSDFQNAPGVHETRAD